jgi:TolB-like protein
LFNYYWKKISRVAGLVLVVFLALSITAQAVEKSPGNNGTRTSIAVISFQPLAPEEGSGNTVFCPICGIGSSSGKVLKGSEKEVEEIFVNKLRELKEVKLIPADKVQSVYKSVSSESLKRNFIEQLKEAGNESGADFLAVGYVYRYVERVGYKYSSEHPASVAFEIHLINAIDGSLVWRGYFDKTQKSLMEDVFQVSSFFKGGGTWMTASQLTQQGMDKIFKTFPKFEH